MEAIMDKRQISINFLIVIAAIAAMSAEHLGFRQVYLFLKPLTTILVISLLVLIPKINNANFRNLMLAAFIFCLLGDILLLFEAYFVFGLASFLSAHLLFTLSFIKLKGFSTHVLSFVFVFGVGTGIFFWLKPDLGTFLIPVSLYILVISLMAWQGIGLYLRNKGRAYAWIAVAVMLFMLSDTMIALVKFKAPFAYSSFLILGTYWLSIGLLANATYRIVQKEKA